MTTSSFRIERVDESHLEALASLVQRIEAEDHLEEPAVAEHAPEAVRRSLEHFDWLHSDRVWIFLALVEDQPAGMALHTRIPKLDNRCGLLYLDELHVLEPFRRRGIGRALLLRGFELARELGLGGVRLFTRPRNAPARALYESVGFQGNENVLYALSFDHSSVQA